MLHPILSWSVSTTARMLCCMQRSEQQQFLFDTTVEQLVKDTLNEVACIHNLRQRITKLKLEGTELAQYGPAKKPDQQGIDTYADDATEKGEHYKMDPTGRRTGNGARLGAGAALHAEKYL